MSIALDTTLDDLVLDTSQEPVRDALASPHRVRGENGPPRWRIPLTGVASLLEVDRISAVALGWRAGLSDLPFEVETRTVPQAFAPAAITAGVTEEMFL